MGEPNIVITCEHAVNSIPADFNGLFDVHGQLLESHRGYDMGALVLAETMGHVLSVPVFRSSVSRLLIDCNRSPGHPALFSSISRDLDREKRAVVIARYYRPFRIAVERRIGRLVERGVQVLHVSMHSFTPILDGIERNCDIGLLYDPARGGEKEFCRRLGESLSRSLPSFRVRRNYPYRGTADGFATYLRKRYTDDAYRGIEIEVNQAFGSAHSWKTAGELIAGSVLEMLHNQGIF